MMLDPASVAAKLPRAQERSEFGPAKLARPGRFPSDDDLWVSQDIIARHGPV